MARAWVTDRWVKDAVVTMPDGSTTRISPTSAQLRALKSLPEHFRTAKFGKGSRWVAGWYEPDGTQRQKLFERRFDAEAFVAALEDDIRSDRYIDPASRERLFSEVAETWLSSKKRIKDSSWRRYRRELDNYVLPQWGARTVGSITRAQIDDWVTHLQAGTAPYVFDVNKHIKAKAREAGPMSPTYMRNVVGATFGGAMRYAVTEKWIGVNPLDRVELPRHEGDLEADLPSLSYPTIEALADAASEHTGQSDDGELLRMLAYSGPRIGEATALKVKDLDLARNRARIHRTWTVDRDGRRKPGPVKTWEKRWLPLAPFLSSRLEPLVKDRDPEEYLFTARRATSIDGGNFRNRVWYKVIPGTAAADYALHDLRHVAATNAIAAGGDVKLVQQMLGHKDATETLNTYAHLWPERTGEVMAAVEKKRAAALAAADAMVLAS